MTDPRIAIRKIVKTAQATAAHHRLPLGAVYIDRPFYDRVCRAYAVDPRNAPSGVRLEGTKIAPLDVVITGTDWAK